MIDWTVFEAKKHANDGDAEDDDIISCHLKLHNTVDRPALRVVFFSTQRRELD